MRKLLLFLSLLLLIPALTHAEEKTVTTTITGIDGQQGTTEIDLDLLPNTGSEVWHVITPEKCYHATDTSEKGAGAHLGSGKTQFNGTITLKKTSIPDNATITKISLKVYIKDTAYSVTPKVNGNELCKTTKLSAGSSAGPIIQTFTGSQIGNEIELAFSTTQNAYIHIQEISVTYEEGSGTPTPTEPQTYSAPFAGKEYSVYVGEQFDLTSELGASHPAISYTIAEGGHTYVENIEGDKFKGITITESPVKVTASWDADDNWNAGTADFTITVTEKPTEICDILTPAAFGLTLNPSSATYTSGEYTSKESGIKYNYKLAVKQHKTYFQSNSKSPYGIVISNNPKGYIIKKVEIEVAEGEKTISVYGSPKTYSGDDASALYNTNTQGELIKEFTSSGSTDALESSNYKGLGIRAKNGVIYISSIKIYYIEEEPEVIVAPTSLTFDPASGAEFAYEQEAVVKVAVDENASDCDIYYSWDGEASQESAKYDEAGIKVPADKAGQITLYVLASNTAGSVNATATYTVAAPAKKDFTDAYTFAKEYTIYDGESIEFNFPENAPEIKYTIDADKIEPVGCVVIDNGKIIGKTKGIAHITASWTESDYWNAGTVEFSVNVTEREIDINQPYTATFDFSIAEDEEGYGAYGLKVHTDSEYEENSCTISEEKIQLSLSQNYRLYKDNNDVVTLRLAKQGTNGTIGAKTGIMDFTAPEGYYFYKFDFTMADANVGIPGEDENLTPAKNHVWTAPKNAKTARFIGGTSVSQIKAVKVYLTAVGSASCVDDVIATLSEQPVDENRMTKYAVPVDLEGGLHKFATHADGHIYVTDNINGHGILLEDVPEDMNHDKAIRNLYIKAQKDENGRVVRYKYAGFHDEAEADAAPVAGVVNVEKLLENTANFKHHYITTDDVMYYFVDADGQPKVAHWTYWYNHNPQTSEVAKRAQAQAIEVVNTTLDVVMPEGVNGDDYNKKHFTPTGYIEMNENGAPVFMVTNAGEVVTSVDEVLDDETVMVAGGKLVAPQGSRVFNINGVAVDGTELSAGIYIVVTPAGKAHKVAL
ncbi:MAG: hypothetical protein NC217_08635 [Muribaculaceae bacterium]|nr:hypothetical protein [Muribaculaceae bacterium]